MALRAATWIFLLGLTHIGIAAQADEQVRGPYLPPDQNPSASCALQFGRGVHFCSAVLIDSKHVLTNAHCLKSVPKTFTNDLRQFRVSCGNRQYSSHWKRHYFAKGSKKAVMEGGSIPAFSDLMIVELMTPFTSGMAEPMRRVESMDETRRLTALNQCFFSGSGGDNQGYHGTVHTVAMPNIDVNPLAGMRSHLLSGKDEELSAQSGDSGGALFCKDELGENVLIGLHRGSLKGRPTAAGNSKLPRGTDFALALGTSKMKSWISGVLEKRFQATIEPLTQKLR